MAAPAPPPGFVRTAPAPPPGFVRAAPVDMRRSAQPFTPTPGVIGHRDWWDANAARLGLPANPTSLDEITQARQQNDPEGFAAFNASQQGQQFNAAPTTVAWTPEAQAQNLRPGGVGGLVRNFMQGATFNWADEAMSNPELYRQLLEGDRTVDPTGTTLAELGGGLATTALPAGWAARGAGTAGKVFKGLLAGTTAGAVAGAGGADGNWSDRANAALRAAIPAGVLGAGLPVVAPAIAKSLRGIIPDRAGATGGVLPTVDEMRTGAQAAYQRADDAGMTVARPSTENFALDAYQNLLDNGLARSPDIASRLTPKASAAMDLLLSEASRSQHSLRDLENLRRMVSGAAGGAAPDDMRLVLTLRDDIDEWLDNLTPADVVAGNPEEAVAALREARSLWSRMRKTEIIEDIENRAEISVGQSVNAAGVEQALRREFGNLAKNPRRMARFSEEEQAAIRAVVEGGPMVNVLRRLSTFAPRGFFSTALGLFGASTGNLPMIGLTIAGEASKRGRDALTRSAVGRVNSMVRTGGAQPIPVGSAGVLGALQAGNMTQSPRMGALLPPSIRLPMGVLPVR